MSKKIKLTIDGVIYHRQATGGISRIFNEIIPRMLDLNSDLDLSVLVEGDERRCPVKDDRVDYRSSSNVRTNFGKFIPSEKFIRVVKSLYHKKPVRLANDDRGESIWHSSYYTLPPESWTGPVVISVYDMIHEKYPQYFSGPQNIVFRKQKEKALKRADAIISISQTTANDLVDIYGIDREKIHVVHLACADIFKKDDLNHLSQDEQDPYFLYIGHRIHYKNFDRFARCFAKVRREYACRAVLVGPKLTEDEKGLFKHIGIENFVDSKTHVSDEELKQLYANAHAFVYPSLYEGFGIPLLEAMAAGCPVIASRIPSTEEIAGDVPYYFAAESDPDLVRAMKQTLESSKDIDRLKRGLQRESDFSWDKTAEKILAVYQSL